MQLPSIADKETGYETRPVSLLYAFVRYCFSVFVGLDRAQNTKGIQMQMNS